MYWRCLLWLWLGVPLVVQAQMLGEPTAIQHFYGAHYWKRQELWGERGLGKYLLLQHLPEHWYAGLLYQPREEPPHGVFGVETLQLRALADNSFSLQLQGANTGAWTADLLARFSLQQVNTSLRVSGYGLSTKNDQNGDGYLDEPLQRRLLLDNTWAIYLRRFTSLNTIRFLTWNAQGGQINYNPLEDYGTTRAYGNGQQGSHLTYTAQNYISIKDDNSWTLDWHFNDHRHTRYYGLRQYEGRTWQLRAQTTFLYRLPDEFNHFKAGLFYHDQNTRERLDSLSLNRREGFGGGYVGYESRLHERLQLSTRLYVGYHNLARLQVLPYGKLSLFLPRNWRIHLLGGSGIRYANALDEHQHLLESQRRVVVAEPLGAEQAWYYGASLDYNTWVDRQQRWLLALEGHFYFTWYANKIVADVDADPYVLSFYNSGQTAQEVSFLLRQRWTYLRTGLALMLHYRYDGWNTPISGRLRQEPYYAPHHLLLGLEAPIGFSAIKWAQFRTQMTLHAGRRLPNLTDKAQAAGWNDYPDWAGAVVRWDLRLTLDGSSWLFQRWKLARWTLFVGIDNLLNAQQPIAPIGGNQPFEPFFDASLNGLSFVGRRFYLGVQYSFSK